MKRFPGLLIALRYIGLLAIVFFGVVCVIGTGGDSGGDNGDAGYSKAYDGVYYHRDADGDGYGDPNISMKSTSQPEGYVSDYTDCDDSDPRVNPGEKEYYWDNIDNNCDGNINEGGPCTDEDGDGYFVEMGCGAEPDCDDTNPDIHPGGDDFYCDGLDSNCNGEIDDGCVCTDKDGDGYCAETDLGLPVDCDDTRADVHPGAFEMCGNNIDNDCNGKIDEGCPFLPDTGQTTCYDTYGDVIDCSDQGNAYYGQDACYTINPPSFTKLDWYGNELPADAAAWGMVRDNVTGLVWEVKTTLFRSDLHDKDNKYNRLNVSSNFLSQLNNVQFGGHSDWRLPTIKELIYLANYGTYGADSPAIDTAYFPNTMPGDYLSSTETPCQASVFLRVHFGTGFIHRSDAFCYVRAVRGESISSLYTNNGDGTITDQTTGLMWMQSTADIDGDGLISANDRRNWLGALQWCENVSLAGYNDWRLPSLKELASIVDYAAEGSTINTVYFPDTVSASYWTSTTADADYRNYALCISFHCGDAARDQKNFPEYVRAVRGGE